MNNLSPAAQAVLDAYGNRVKADLLGRWVEPAIAAALQAAVDQVVPQELIECEHFTNEAVRLNRMGTRSQFLAIAAELEAINES